MKQPVSWVEEQLKPPMKEDNKLLNRKQMKEGSSS